MEPVHSRAGDAQTGPAGLDERPSDGAGSAAAGDEETLDTGRQTPPARANEVVNVKAGKDKNSPRLAADVDPRDKKDRNRQ